MNITFFKALLYGIVLAMSFTVAYGKNLAEANNITKSISIGKTFVGLRANAGMEITYTQDDRHSVAVISGPAEIVEGITWKVDNDGFLSFKYPPQKKNHSIQGNITVKLNGGLLLNYSATSSGSIKVTTEVESLRDVDISATSSGKIYMQRNISTGKGDITVTASSSSQIIFANEVNCQGLNTTASSGSIIKLGDSTVGEFNFSGSSSAILNAVNLTAQKINIDISSGATVELQDCNCVSSSFSCSSGAELNCMEYTVGQANIQVSSGGSIDLTGKCKNATISASSGGSLNIKGFDISKINSQSISSGGSVILR